jgi:CRISPR-associated protein Csb2
MTRYLCISATFLDPYFHGKGDEKPEWPPSPMRLFQALIAGTRAGCREKEWTTEKAAAFRWLEQQPAPVIVAPIARETIGFTLFVPNNDGDKKFKREERLTSKVVHPYALCDGDTVYYLWPIADDEWPGVQTYVDEICRAARHLLALGWGIDQVVGNGCVLAEADATALSGQRWQPTSLHRPDAPTWRIPTDGTLDDLERAHQAYLNRIATKQYRAQVTRYYTVEYRHTLPLRPYAAFELPDGLAFRQENTAKVAAMLRSLASRFAQKDTHVFPGGSEVYVSGHAGKEIQTPPRFSYLPLPSIGHVHADGMIRRLLIAEPFGGDGCHARWAQQRLRGARLQDEDGEDRGILLDLWRAASKGIVARYVGESDAWTTVTPVILPGYDDGKHAKAEKLVFAAVEQAGLPREAIREVVIRKAPFWPGSQHPRQYFLPNYLRGLPGWHVRLVFGDALSGPLAIGAGRHIGLGLFAHAQ